MNNHADLHAGGSRSLTTALALPSNVETEQALLGALLVNNDVYGRVASLLKAEHFFDPVHARIYAAAERLIQSGRGVDHVLLKSFLMDDAGLSDLGGPAYLARLSGAAISIYSVTDYAVEIAHLFERRTIMQAAMAAGEAAADRSRDLGAVVDDFDEVAAAALGQQHSRVATAFASAVDALKELSAALENERPAHIASGLASIDRAIAIRGGKLVLLGGRPAMGKTALALSLAQRYARDGHPVLFFSGEMDRIEIAQRVLAEATTEAGVRVAYRDIANPIRLDDEQIRALGQAATGLQAMPLVFHDGGAPSQGGLIAEARRWVRRVRAAADRAEPGDPLKPPPTPVLFVDYLQLVRGSDPRARTIDHVSAVSMALKSLALGEGIAVIALAQLSRQVESREDKRPQLSDLRESGQLEQDADVVLFTYREEYYAEREEPPESDIEANMKWQERMEQVRGRMEVICAKQRSGPIGVHTIRCSLACNLFWDDEWMR